MKMAFFSVWGEDDYSLVPFGATGHSRESNFTLHCLSMVSATVNKANKLRMETLSPSWALERVQDPKRPMGHFETHGQYL